MYKMIVVDDSETTRQGIRASVNWEVMDVRIVGEAADGLEAMVLIHDTDPDIIICDIRMPKLDGIALINEVLPSHPSLQVIFFSGYSDKEYLKNAIKLEAVDYLYKPLQLHELIGAVEKAKKKCMNKKVHLPQNEADLALSLLQCSENEIPSDLPLDLHAPLVTVIVQMNTAGEHMADRAYDNQLDDLLLASRHYLAFQTVAARIFDGKFVMSCAGKGYILHANVSQDFLNRKTAEVKLSPFFTTLDSGQADVVVGLVVLGVELEAVAPVPAASDQGVGTEQQPVGIGVARLPRGGLGAADAAQHHEPLACRSGLHLGLGQAGRSAPPRLQATHAPLNRLRAERTADELVKSRVFEHRQHVDGGL